jgi:hypothetical protein
MDIRTSGPAKLQPPAPPEPQAPDAPPAAEAPVQDLPKAAPADQVKTSFADPFEAGAEFELEPIEAVVPLADKAPASEGITTAGAAGAKPSDGAYPVNNGPHGTYVNGKEREQALKEVEGAQKAYDVQKDRVEKRDQELAEALDRFGPGLTDDQKQKVVEQWKKDNAGDYDGLKKAETDLGAAVAKNEAYLLDVYHQVYLPSDHESQVVTRALAALAGSKTPANAEKAKDLAFKLLATDNPDYQKNLPVDFLSDQVLVPAFQNALPGAADDPEKAGAPYEQFAAQMKGVYDLYSKGKGVGDKYKKFQSYGAQAKELAEALGEANPTKAMKGLQAIREKYGKTGPAANALAMSGVVSAAYKFGDAVSKGEAGEAFKAAIDVAANGAEFWVQATNFTARIAGNGQVAGKYLARMAPGLSAVASLVSAGNALVKGKLMAAGIDAFTAVGLAVGIANPVAGALLVGVATAVQIGYDLYKGNKEREAARKDQAQVLKELGLPLYDVFADGKDDGAGLKDMAGQYGFRPEQVQELVKMGYADTFKNSRQGNATFDGLMKGLGGGEFAPDQAYKLLTFIAQKYPNPEDRRKALAAMDGTVANIYENERSTLGWVSTGAGRDVQLPQNHQWWTEKINAVGTGKPPYQAAQKGFGNDPVLKNGPALLNEFLNQPTAPRSGDR